MKMTFAVLAALAATLVSARSMPRSGSADSPPGAKGRTLRSVRGRCSISDLGCGGSGPGPGEHLAPASPRLGRHGIPACQHDRNTDLLGSDRRAARAVRLFVDRQAPGAKPASIMCVSSCSGSPRGRTAASTICPNGCCLDPVRYFHAVDRNGEAVDSPSPFATASLEADKKAFAAVMGHLKQADPQRTVIMVQVENETGNWKSVRDFSPAAQKFFEAPVPPEILKAMHVKTASSSPNWQAGLWSQCGRVLQRLGDGEICGTRSRPRERRFIPCPWTSTHALRNPFHPGPPGEPGSPGAYESGGPTDNVIPIWKAAAPAIDILAPDDYQGDPAAYVKVLELYRRDDNALFLPESGCFECDPATWRLYPLFLHDTRSSGPSETRNPEMNPCLIWRGISCWSARCSGRSPASISKGSSRPWLSRCTSRAETRATPGRRCRSEPGTRW